MKTATAVLAIVAAGTFTVAVTSLPANGSPYPADDPVPGILSDDQQTEPQPPAPTAPPPADGTFRTGPSQAPACSGITITTAQDAAQVVEDAPAGTTFCFTAGWHRIS